MSNVIGKLYRQNGKPNDVAVFESGKGAPTWDPDLFIHIILFKNSPSFPLSNVFGQFFIKKLGQLFPIRPLS